MTATRGATAEQNDTDGGTDSTPDTRRNRPQILILKPPSQTPTGEGATLPVYAYDVTTTGVGETPPRPRLVVSMRDPFEAQAMAGRLNAMESAGQLVAPDRYTVDLPRDITRHVVADPMKPLKASGYVLTPDAFAPADQPSPQPS